MEGGEEGVSGRVERIQIVRAWVAEGGYEERTHWLWFGR